MKAIAVLVCLLSLSTVARADTLEELFARSTQAAASGDFKSALLGYKQLEEADVYDPDLYANVATVHAKTGDLPRAILYFEKALRLAPGDASAEAGLQQVEEYIAGQRAELEGEAVLQRDLSILSSMVRGFSANSLSWTVVIANALFFFLLTGWVIRTKLTRPHGSTIAAIVISALLLCVSSLGLAVKSGVGSKGEAAVILADRVALREGPGERAQLRSEARGGERSTIVRKSDGYVLLHLGDGRRGWATASDVGAI